MSECVCDGRGARVRDLDVGLVPGGAVDEEAAVPHLHRLPRARHHPLDEDLLLLQPAPQARSRGSAPPGAVAKGTGTCRSLRHNKARARK